MLQDPIVARKSRGKFIISAIKDTDPIQLIRQLNEKELEVHLKNGTTYIEQVTPDELDLVILELMGYREETLLISFHAWPECQKGLINFKMSEKQLDNVGNDLLNYIFEPTPFIKSKFISFDLSAIEQKKEYYDEIYGAYDVDASLTFWCRADMTKDIANHIDCEGRYDFSGIISSRAKIKNSRICRNDISFEFLKQD